MRVESLKDYEVFFKDLAISHENNLTPFILLTGDMGAGKTTFVQEFLKFHFSLSEKDIIEKSVSSPTFSLENEYDIKGSKVLHCDFYRVKQDTYDREDFVERAEDFDWVFIEWPENLNLKDLLINYLEVSLSLVKESEGSYSREVLLRGLSE